MFFSLEPPSEPEERGSDILSRMVKDEQARQRRIRILQLQYPDIDARAADGLSHCSCQVDVSTMYEEREWRNKNCAFILSGLPQDVTATEILDLCINTGPIRCLHLTSARRGTKEARLVFTNCESANNCWAQSWKAKKWFGNTIGIKYDSERPCCDLVGKATRVLSIGVDLDNGNPRIVPLVDFDYLTAYFEQFYDMDLENKYTCEEKGMRWITFCFCRIDNQAEVCYNAIKQHPDFDIIGIHAHWGYDNCAGGIWKGRLRQKSVAGSGAQ